MHLRDIYYLLKPFMPRQLQLALRRQVVRRQRRAAAEIWPIDQRAAMPPEGWQVDRYGFAAAAS